MNKMTDEKLMENVVLFGLEAATKMLNEYGSVIPFCVSGNLETEELRMKCYREEFPEDEWHDLILSTAQEIRSAIQIEKISIAALVTTLESKDSTGIGFQVDTPLSSVLFVYPYKKVKGEWKIEEPQKIDSTLTAPLFELP